MSSLNLASLGVGMLVGMVVWQLWRRQRRMVRRRWQKKETSLPRHWHPKSEKAYAGCREGVQVTVERVKQAAQAYGSQKQKRGARKRLSSEGYACPCRTCPYFGNSHDAVPALVGYGRLGKDKHIQRWRCQACRTTFSCRRGTLLYYLKSEPALVELV